MASVDLTRIASNIGALNSLNSLENINKQLSLHQTRLSTGKRINSAADDPAGLTIATKMLARSEGMKVALDNIGDAKNMLSVAEAGMSKINDILVQMRSKAEQAASDTLGTSERSAIQTQLSAYAQQIQDLVDQTKWNGVKLLDTSTGSKQFQTGVDEGEYTTWSMQSQLDPKNMNLSTNQATSDTANIIAGGSFVNVSSKAAEYTTTLGSLSQLATGGYKLHVLDTANANGTDGTVHMNGLYMSGVSGIGATATPPSANELASGHYTLTITAATSATDTSYTLTNTDTNVTTTVANANISTGDLLVDTTAGHFAGMKLNFTSDASKLVAGQTMNFEYIHSNEAKVELQDGSGQAMEVAQDSTASKTGTYAYATQNADYNTGRGVVVKLNTIGNLVKDHTNAFDYLQANAYSVDVSSATKAAKYMTKVNSAMDKVNGAMSDLGSLMARLTFKEDAVTSAQINVEASYSRIMNANMAEEQVNASKFQILQQTATAMLAQANQAPQNLLSLFR